VVLLYGLFKWGRILTVNFEILSNYVNGVRCPLVLVRNIILHFGSLSKSVRYVRHKVVFCPWKMCGDLHSSGMLRDLGWYLVSTTNLPSAISRKSKDLIYMAAENTSTAYNGCRVVTSQFTEQLTKTQYGTSQDNNVDTAGFQQTRLVRYLVRILSVNGFVMFPSSKNVNPIRCVALTIQGNVFYKQPAYHYENMIVRPENIERRLLLNYSKANKLKLFSVQQKGNNNVPENVLKIQASWDMTPL
jgi:hypothetical protein